jgi:hypothetical protein
VLTSLLPHYVQYYIQLKIVSYGRFQPGVPPQVGHLKTTLPDSLTLNNSNTLYQLSKCKIRFCMRK